MVLLVGRFIFADPQQCVGADFKVWGRSLAVGQNHETVVRGLDIQVIVNDGLEVRAATTVDNELRQSALQRFDALDFGIKLEDVDADFSLQEEAVDDAEEAFQVLLVDAARAVDSNEYAGCNLS